MLHDHDTTTRHNCWTRHDTTRCELRPKSTALLSCFEQPFFCRAGLSTVVSCAVVLCRDALRVNFAAARFALADAAGRAAMLAVLLLAALLLSAVCGGLRRADGRAHITPGLVTGPRATPTASA